jgi:hypothetical protein
MTQNWLTRALLPVGWGMVLSVTVLCGPAGAGQSGSPGAAATPVARIRALDERAAATLQKGLERSTRFERLVGALEASDLVVYIQTAPLRTRGLLTFMAATPAGRLVRISLDSKSMEPCIIGLLGHELQHALEVAGAPDVRDQKSLEQLYARIGERSSSGGWCTRPAQLAGAAVLDELRGHSAR